MKYSSLMSWIECCDVIKHGCDVLYSAYCDIHIVCVMTYIKSVLYHQYSGCDHTDTDIEGLMSDIAVVLSKHNVIDVKNYCICINKHSGSDVTYVVAVMSQG